MNDLTRTMVAGFGASRRSLLAFDTRPVFFTIGALLMILSLGMCGPGFVDLYVGNDGWPAFFISGGLTLFVGTALVLAYRAPFRAISIRQAYLLTALIWVVLTLFASLPFLFAPLSLSFTDAYFEAMSGITTTGSTVLTGLDSMPDGILVWRAVLQWLGGLGIVVMTICILPMMRVGGMQMFRVEAFETDGKMLPRAGQLSARVSLVLIAFTVLLVIALSLAGMNGTEAVVHAMTTIATGGYSTSDGSVGHFDSAAIDLIIIAGMTAGGIPFLLFLRAVHGDWRSLMRDSQVRAFLAVLAVATASVALWLVARQGFSPLQALRYSAFNVISITTGTGYASADYTQWGSFPSGVMFVLMFVGGCYGSTACGMKIFRFQILASVSSVQIRRLFRPNAVIFPTFNHRPLSEEVANSVVGYFFFFILFWAGLSIALTFDGLDLVTALSGAGTAMANVGPGLGNIIGPAGTFQSLPDLSKWLLVAGMLVGRLEVFTIFVIFTPSFWRD